MIALCKIIINLNRKWATNKWIIYVSRIQIECTKFIAKFVLLGDRNKKSFLKFEVGNWLWYIGWTIAPQPESREFKPQNQLDLFYPRQMNSDASGNKMKIEHIFLSLAFSKYLNKSRFVKYTPTNCSTRAEEKEKLTQHT